MRRVFLSGALAQGPVLAQVLGAEALPEMEPASFEGGILVPGSGENACFPKLYPQSDAQVAGVLLGLAAEDEHAFQRLSYLAEALGMVPVPKHVEVNGTRRAAIAFVATAAAPDLSTTHPGFDAAEWQRDWAEIARHATQEILRYEGRVPATALDWRMGMILTRAAARAAAAARPAPATLRSATQSDAVRIQSEEQPHEGFFLTRRYDLQPPRFDGTPSPVLRREVFVAADAALVLPYDPRTDHVLLVEQFRMGPFGRGDPYPFVLEPVAGHVDAGETPEEAAHRETQEEAGLSLQGLEHISSHYCSPGCSTEVFHCFLGLTDLPEPGQGSGGLGIENEDIRTHVISFDEAQALITSGEANIGPLVLMLLWLSQHRARLRAAA